VTKRSNHEPNVAVRNDGLGLTLFGLATGTAQADPIFGPSYSGGNSLVSRRPFLITDQE
jgi:hypothetical protein